jgi:hypothetical protein
MFSLISLFLWRNQRALPKENEEYKGKGSEMMMVMCFGPQRHVYLFICLLGCCCLIDGQQRAAGWSRYFSAKIKLMNKKYINRRTKPWACTHKLTINPLNGLKRHVNLNPLRCLCSWRGQGHAIHPGWCRNL